MEINMDSTMFQLRSFVHQRLYSAAEEILGEVETAITLVLKAAEVIRWKDLHQEKPDSSLTRTKVEHRDEHDSPPHQEIPRPSTPDESFSLSAEVPGPSQTRAHIGKNNWNYCLVQVGDVCLPERLSSQITQLNDHSEVSSLKMPKRMKRKRTCGPNRQGNSVGTLHHGTAPNQLQLPPSLAPAATNNKAATTTSHTAEVHPSSSSLAAQDSPAGIDPPTSSTAGAAPSPPKIFKEICSILPLSSGGKKKRCKITVEELARRVGPPEYMSFSSLVAYLRADNNTRKELQAQLEEVGIKPSDLTTEITLFSRLCEEEIDALCESLADLVQDHLPFQGLQVIPEAEDELVTLGRLEEFRFYLKRAVAAIKERVEVVDLASHGFMSKMLDIILFVFERCLDNQMSGRLVF